MRAALQSKWLLASVMLAVLAGCDPPGKPGPQSEELAAPSDFKNVFAENCSGCHGRDGRQGPGRVLNDPLYMTFVSKESLQQVIERGRPGTSMPPWAKSSGGPLDESQVSILVEGMEANWKKPFDKRGTSVPAYDGAGLTGHPDVGKKLFLRNCYACHAKGGVAGPINEGAYLSLSSNQNLRTSIVVGRPDFPKLPMPNYSVLNGGHALADQDVADLVGYLSSLRPMNSAVAQAEMQNPDKSAEATRQ